MKKRILLLSCIALVLVGKGYAQDEEDFDNLSFNDFKKSIRKDFNNFRSEIMKDFADFVRNPWKSFEAEKPIPRPKEDDVPPVVYKDKGEKKKIKDKPIVIDTVLHSPLPTPQPLPIKPIKETPIVNPHCENVSFYGYQAKVRCPERPIFTLRGVDENAIADALMQLSDKANDNLIYDCLQLRSQWKLCDWAYLELLNAVADKICGQGTNESTLLMAYLYQQSGYRMRFARSAGKLYILYASPFTIFGQAYYRLDDGYSYFGYGVLPVSLQICQASYPKESLMSLYMKQPQQFPVETDTVRKISSKRYEGLSIEVAVNKNLMKFYEHYPTAKIGDNMVSRWAIYANTPLQPEVKDQIYPKLKAYLQGKSDYDAAKCLLNLLQTGLEYQYDDVVWGRDRAFFSEETLYYPYADCEDRAILYSRLVRDLIGLKVILVYYPGHLATAVHFNEEVLGDYIDLNGERFIIADPTFVGAPIGTTMSSMNNATASVILLE